MGGMPKSATVLLVEDNPGDQRLALEAFRTVDWVRSAYVVGDGSRAFAFLKHKGEFASAPTPDLIVLDLGLPGKPGQEVLAELKQDPELKGIPVFVLTGSEAGQDASESYALGAMSYLTKPEHFDSFLGTVQTMGDAWKALPEITIERRTGSLRKVTRRLIRKVSGSELFTFLWMLAVAILLVLVAIFKKH